MKVSCDKCQKGFEMKPRKKKHSISIIETYIRCPHCKHHYTSYVTDQEARKLQKEIKILNQKIKSEADPYEKEKIFVELTDKKVELKKHMESLKVELASR